jgi:hypothetical protein
MGYILARVGPARSLRRWRAVWPAVAPLPVPSSTAEDTQLESDWVKVKSKSDPLAIEAKLVTTYRPELE